MAGQVMRHRKGQEMVESTTPVISLRPLSRSLPALSSAVLPLEEELSASDAMESEADRMARFGGTACAASRTFNTGGASFLK
jgi:hypothetical protein